MTKKTPEATVKVVLTCIYSGLEQSWNPGDVIELDAEEADRLLSIGAAKPYDPPAEAATE